MSDKRLLLSVIFKGTDALSGSLRSIMGASGGAGAATRRLSTALRDQKKELAELSSKMSSSSGNITDLYNAEKKLERQVAETTRKLEAQKKSAAKIYQAEAIGQKATASGQTNMAVGAGLAAPLILSAKASADFQDGMTDIRQKADLSAEATARLEKSIMAAAAAAYQLPENLRQGVDTLTGFGLSTAAAEQMIAPIGRAATAYRAEIADLSAATYAATDNLKVPINQTAKSLDVMAYAGKRGAFEMRDMATFFPMLTASAQGLGQKGVSAVADLSAALQIARKGAGSSEAAATNLQNLLAKINTKETIKNFADFGIDLPKELKKAYAAGKTPLEAIAELTNRATGGNMDKLSFLFGDMQAQQALRPLIANMAEYRNIRAEALKASGVVDADFAIRAQNASVQSRALMGSLMKLGVSLGSTLLPGLVSAAQKMSSVAQGVAEWADKHPKLTSFLVQTVAAIAAFSLTLGAARIAYGTTIGPLVKLFQGFNMLRQSTTAVKMMSGVMPLLSSTFGVLRGAALMLGRGLMQAGMMMMANPIILIITAIVVAVGIAGYLIYKNWDKIKAAFASGLAYMKNLWNGFKEVGKHLMMGLISGITEKVNAIKSMIIGIGQNVAGWFKGVLGIKSPSRVFMGFGGHITEGLRLGIANNAPDVFKQARALAAGVTVAGTMAAAPMVTPALAMPAMAQGAGTSQIQAQYQGNLFTAADIFKQARALAAGVTVSGGMAAAPMVTPALAMPAMAQGAGTSQIQAQYQGNLFTAADIFKQARALAAGVTVSGGMASPSQPTGPLGIFPPAPALTAPKPVAQGAGNSQGQGFGSVYIAPGAIVINTTPNQSASDIANEVMRLIEQKMRAKARTSYSDS